MTELTTVAAELERNKWGQPMVLPPGGGKPVAYQRCTRFVDALEDTYNLNLWMQRMVATGLSQRDDLLLAVAAAGDDKKELNRLCSEAREAAKASAAATTGTALHSLTEQYDRGTLPPLTSIPKQYRPDLRAYIKATKPLTFTHIEQFMVHDELRIGGTPDRICEYNGRRHIADLKTGNIEWAALKIAQQLAVYAHSQLYRIADGTRTPVDVDLERAIIIHLPAGEGTATLHWVDIAAGWEAVQVSKQVREWRRKKHLTTPWPTESDPDTMIQGDIIDAQTETAVRAVYTRYQDDWTDAHTALAVARIDALTNGAGSTPPVHQHG